MRILTRVTASSGIDISSNNTDTITLGNSSVDNIIANAPITASGGITGSVGNFNALFINGLQITGSVGAGNLVTSGSITGSGTQDNPIDLKSNISILTVTASTGIASGRGDFNSLFVNGNPVSTGSAGGLSIVETSGSITGSGIAGNEIRLKDQISVSGITSSFSGNGSLITNITASNITNFASNVISLSTTAGTANQVLVNGGTAAASGSVTLSLPQSIATTSSPTFADITALTGSRLGSSNVYGLDIINISSPVVARGVRLVSSSLAGSSNLFGDYVAIGTVGTTNGILLSSSANIVNSSPNVAVSGTLNVNKANFYSTLRATGSCDYVILQPNTEFTASAPVMVYGDQINTSLNYINGQNIFINGTSQTTITCTTNYIGIPSYIPVDSRTTIESDNIDLSGSVNVTGTLYVNGVQITGSGGGGGGGGSTAYDIAGIYNGKPLASETIFRFVAVRSYDFSTTSADHYFYSAVTSSASKTFDLYRNATLIGSVAFSANNGFGTVTINSASVVAGEIFSVLAPSSQDTTLSDLYFTFKADTV